MKHFLVLHLLDNLPRATMWQGEPAAVEITKRQRQSGFHIRRLPPPRRRSPSLPEGGNHTPFLSRVAVAPSAAMRSTGRRGRRPLRVSWYAPPLRIATAVSKAGQRLASPLVGGGGGVADGEGYCKVRAPRE